MKEHLMIDYSEWLVANETTRDTLAHLNPPLAREYAVREQRDLRVGSPAHRRDLRDAYRARMDLAARWRMRLLILGWSEEGIDLAIHDGRLVAGPLVRVQRRRVRGWTKPPNTGNITRPGPWGNPYPLPKHAGPRQRRKLVGLYLAHLDRELAAGRLDLEDLMGWGHLMCWCPIDAEWCHGDELVRRCNKLWRSR